MRGLGLAPDFIVCRAPQPVRQNARQKISLFCNVPEENVLTIHDVPNIYHVPSVMLDQNFDEILRKRLNLSVGKKNDVKKNWEDMVKKIDTAKDVAAIALVGKYTTLGDSYLSVTSALKHACIETDQRLKLVMIDSSDLEHETAESDHDAYVEAWNKLKGVDGVLIPGGFGIRGIEGKIEGRSS